MKYCLVSHGFRPSVEITQTEYEAIREAKSFLFGIIRVEESFDALIEDYVELEETLLHFGIRHLAFAFKDSSLNQTRGVMNRRVLHLLSAARLYRDGLQKRAKLLLSRDNLAELNSRLKDSSSQPISFRIVEALRNFAQHDDFPISGMTFRSSWEKGSERIKDRSAFSITPKFDALEVSKSRNLAPDIRKALSELGPNALMITHIREYIEYFGATHTWLRKVIAKSEKEHETTLRDAMSHYQASLPVGVDKAFVVIAARLNDKGKRLDEVQLFDEFFDYRNRLRLKNGTQEKLSRRYVKWHGHESDS